MAYPPHAPYPYVHHGPPPMPGSAVTAVVLVSVGIFLGLGFALMYGILALVATVDEDARQDLTNDAGLVSDPTAMIAFTTLFALMGLAYAVGSLTMAIRAGRRTPGTLRAIVVLQAAAFLSLPLSGWAFFTGTFANLVAAGIMGLYCAVVALLVLSPRSRAYYRSGARNAGPGGGRRR